MVIPSSSANKERLKGRNVELDSRVNIYVRKWRLLLVLNLFKWKIKEIKEIKVKRNIKTISA